MMQFKVYGVAGYKVRYNLAKLHNIDNKSADAFNIFNILLEKLPKIVNADFYYVLGKV
jgi:hypothetical protein